jgi:transcriptional regulator with XRE-family HTH domain
MFRISSAAINVYFAYIQHYYSAMQIGNTIRKLRMAKKLSQQEVADRLGVAQSAYQAWECDRSSPSLKYLLPLASLLEIPLTDLLSENTTPATCLDRNNPAFPEHPGHKLQSKHKRKVYAQLLRSQKQLLQSKQEQLLLQQQLLKQQTLELNWLRTAVGRSLGGLQAHGTVGHIEGALKVFDEHPIIQEQARYMEQELHLWWDALPVGPDTREPGQPGFAAQPDLDYRREGDYWETLYHSPYLELWYNPKWHLISAEWKGFQTLETVRAGGERILSVLIQTQCLRMLNDNRQVVGLWQQAAEWTAEEWFPCMFAAGLERFAWINSPSVFSQLSLQTVLAIISQTKKTDSIRTFKDQSSAYQWLLTQEQS